MKAAFITGISGQDGSYLAELLLDKGYVVYGMVRRSSYINTRRIDHLFAREKLKLVYGDLADPTRTLAILSEIKRDLPDITRLEVYNLAAMSHVKVSFDMPEYTGDVDGLGTLRLLDAVRASGLQSITRFYQASTSELYGKVHETPQNENTPFHPRSPYGVAKLYAFWIVKNYREAYGMFACNGILFNHESPRRGETFVTRKITRGLATILKDPQARLTLGNLDAKRDWGHARDYVGGMWRMLQSDTADDYVLGTGKTYSVREFVVSAFRHRGIEIVWEGEGVDEVGRDATSRRVLVEVSPRYYRPAEVELLLSDPSKAREELGWEAEVSFTELVREMVDADCPLA